jgi:DNA-binding transcriptional LysR family regulator
MKALGRAGDSTETLLRVGVSACIASSIAADFLMPVFSGGESRPSIQTGDFNELLRDLRSRSLDLVIGEAQPSEQARRGLALELVCRPALVALVPRETTAEPDWANLSLVHYRSSSVYRWEVEAYLEAHGLRPNVVAEVDDAFLMLEAVMRGGYAAFVPTSIAGVAMKERNVTVIGTITPQAAGVYALYPRDDKLQLARAAVTRLIDSTRAGTAQS